VQSLLNAVDAVQRNLFAVGLYCGATVLAVVLKVLMDAAVLRHTGSDFESLQAGPYGLLGTIVIIAVLALVRCVAFSRMGKEIDRPLWRIRDDWEAVTRFFPMWLLLDLVTFTCMWLANPNLFGGSQNAVTAICHIAAFVLNIVAVPIGTCVMFSGHLQWKRLGEALSPMVRQLPRSGAVLLVCLFQLVIHDIVAGRLLADPDTPSPFDFLPQRIGLVLVLTYLECIVFAAVWLLCMADREAPDDTDFEF
jgi:hypothetical protein